MSKSSFILLLLSTAGCGEDYDGSCGNPPAGDEITASGLVSWPEECRVLRLHCDFRGLQGLSQAKFRSLARQACRNCSSASGLQVVLTDVSNEANIQLKCEPLAVRGGPLAWCQYPSECGRVVQCRFNTNVYWTSQQFLDTLVHELGHGFGMPHTSQTRDIMYPVLKSDRNINGKYGPHFSGPEMIKRYGLR